MSYDYRTSTLDDFMGNTAIKKYLKSLGDNFSNIKPIMFVGQYGCGKTSLAYMTAKQFGAPEENIDDVNCGYFTDIKSMKERIDDLFKSSLFGIRKVIVLDEVHKLKQPGQSAWLKPLEKLPEDIFVIACTTDHKDLLPTFLSRFNILSVKGLTNLDAEKLVNSVCMINNITLEPWKKELIIKMSNGIPRILISSIFLIKGIESEDEAISLLDLTTIGVSDSSLDIFKYLLSGADWMTIKEKIIEAMKESSPDTLRFDLLNIISGRMASKFFKIESEGKKLVRVFEIISEMVTVPAKAGLIHSMLKSHMIMKGYM